MIFAAPVYIVMPRPISTNHLYNNVDGKGRSVTREYKAWKADAAKHLMAQHPLPRFKVPVDCIVYCGETGIGNMDASNTLKAIEDALVGAGVIKDDSRKHLRSTRAVWVPDMRATIVRVAPAIHQHAADALISNAPAHMQHFLR
ncbi:MAG: RusA family crossover junction endodeoxyribonuclease [Rhizobiales bacterium]|nr:RusA family crossover junction endodeoxyribonuclease [Hyphomicrobiales bacterium]